MALGIIIRSPYTPYSIYFKGTINPLPKTIHSGDGFGSPAFFTSIPGHAGWTECAPMLLPTFKSPFRMKLELPKTLTLGYLDIVLYWFHKHPVYNHFSNWALRLTKANGGALWSPFTHNTLGLYWGPFREAPIWVLGPFPAQCKVA